LAGASSVKHRPIVIDDRQIMREADCHAVSNIAWDGAALISVKKKGVESPGQSDTV
jgi:hypothetical protein